MINYKSIADAELISRENPATGNVHFLLEDDGLLKKLSTSSLMDEVIPEAVTSMMSRSVEITDEFDKENTTVLVEEDGAIKKIPMGSVGGGNGNFLVIRYKAVNEQSIDSDPAGVYIPNMTFAEFDELLLSGSLAGIQLVIYGGNVRFLSCASIEMTDYPNNVIFWCYENNSGQAYCVSFNSDNTITRYYPAE